MYICVNLFSMSISNFQNIYWFPRGRDRDILACSFDFTRLVNTSPSASCTQIHLLYHKSFGPLLGCLILFTVIQSELKRILKFNHVQSLIDLKSLRLVKSVRPGKTCQPWGGPTLVRSPSAPPVILAQSQASQRLSRVKYWRFQGELIH